MDTPFDPTLADDIKQLLTEVPPQIRALFASGKVEIVAKNIMQKNQLHIDQGAIMEREIILLLLGLKDPTEFTQTLATEAQLDQKTVSGIVQDMNTQIFVPLRQEMMRGAGSVQPPKATMPAATPRPIPAAPAAGAAVPPRFFHLDNKLPPAPRPIPPATAMPAMPQAPRPSAQVPVAAAALRTPVPALSQPRAISEVRPSPTILEVAPKIPQPAPFPQPPRPMSAEPIPVQPKSVNILSIAPLPPKIVLPRAVGAGFRPPVTPLSPKPMDSSKLLEDHEEPHIEFHPPSPKATEGAVKVPPPPNLPGAMPPRVVPEVQPTPIIPKVEPPTPPAVLPKPYSADPYREPIE